MHKITFRCKSNRCSQNVPINAIIDPLGQSNALLRNQRLLTKGVGRSRRANKVGIGHQARLMNG